MRRKNGDVDQWMKRVEMASAFAVSEVFSHKKIKSAINSHAVALQSTDQLQDHDEAYSEAQAILSDWMNKKLRLEMEMEPDQDDDLISSAERSSPVVLATAQPTALDYSSFDELYNHLAEEQEDSMINSFLQDLMEHDVLDSGAAQRLASDAEQNRKKMRDPSISMEARHQQVRENRARRDAERLEQQREKEAQRAARVEAKRREREEEMRRRHEARKQEEMLQQEMVRLRRQMEEKKSLEQMVRQREREKLERQSAARSLQSGPPPPKKQQHQDEERLYKEQQIQTLVHIHNLKCLQRHFSGWYSLLLERRMRMGKVAALSDWKRQLRAWRAWRALVWAQQKQREEERTEEELRAENRRCQQATENNRRRLLRRCLNDWRLWCRMEREQREILARQEETRHKMAALINAASAGKLNTAKSTACKALMAPAEASDQPETTKKEDHHRSGSPAPVAPPAHQENLPVGAVTQPTQPWQVSRRHAALTAGELRRARRRGEAGGGASSTCSQRAASLGSHFEHRHAVQQQTITQQRKLLREQKEQIAQLQEEQTIMRVKLDVQRTAQLTQQAPPAPSRPEGLNFDPEKQRALRVTGESDDHCSPPRRAVTRQPCPHPIIMAMEERAHQRAERRREVEELKRKKEEEKLAQMKAAEEERKREEEEEKHRAAERRKEEKRQEREREEKKQQQLKRDQELQTLARQHYRRTLLFRQGLAPWKRLIQLRQTNMQLAECHHNLSLLRRCTLAWQQFADESLSQKEASADQLHQHFLLRRSLSCWKRLKDWQMIQEERANRFHRQHTLRRVLLALLDHVMQERLAEWDRQELAQQYSDRRVLRGCFRAWRQFPCLQRKEREREMRREQLRRKVAEVLPDFRSSPLQWPPGKSQTAGDKTYTDVDDARAHNHIS
ncbi:coiled-coil domain-containing protein 191 isoform X2 [Myripristis murdjan]|nr:coiled-coil domain-containing protein 191 isoform X2 [Myripristis murdjan]XP_029934919.1 coiled-coil domain-containing protein 191 isoform X2 [Myripristis murdjan]